MKLLFQFLSKWGNLLLLFCLFLLFNILLSSFLPKEYVLDLMFAYSSEEAYAALGHLNPSQIHRYKIGIWILDMPYLGIYCLLFSGLMIQIWKNHTTAWLPVAVAAMDLFENLSVLRILGLYPRQNEIWTAIASFFSTSKWVLVGVLIFALVFGLIFSVFSKRNFFEKSTEARI
ncbi:hypothetical protein GCM10009119_26150 [Algoriphagus jejuensis]|uniref:Uncharacterized protein n=1 Tax=Algoriphagus jejuensis TaxID=419934 RepID=A0ABN1N251_9BACT